VANWLHPNLNVWEFQARESWVAYIVRPVGGRWARLRGRAVSRVILLAILDHPPHRAELELLARAVTALGRSGHTR
jgi:hypothetical protein